MNKIAALDLNQPLVALSTKQIEELIAELPNWYLTDHQLARDVKFDNFRQTMFFINALAYLAEQYNHHPDCCFGYNYCKIRLATHDINGISARDFVCALKIEQLF